MNRDIKLKQVKKAWELLEMPENLSAKKRVELIMNWNQQRINYVLHNGRRQKNNGHDLELLHNAIKQALKDVRSDLLITIKEIEKTWKMK